jgi:uncharacterized protein HemX
LNKPSHESSPRADASKRNHGEKKAETFTLSTTGAAVVGIAVVAAIILVIGVILLVIRRRAAHRG